VNPPLNQTCGDLDATFRFCPASVVLAETNRPLLDCLALHGHVTESKKSWDSVTWPRSFFQVTTVSIWACAKISSGKVHTLRQWLFSEESLSYPYFYAQGFWDNFGAVAEGWRTQKGSSFRLNYLQDPAIGQEVVKDLSTPLISSRDKKPGTLQGWEYVSHPEIGGFRSHLGTPRKKLVRSGSPRWKWKSSSNLRCQKFLTFSFFKSGRSIY